MSDSTSKSRIFISYSHRGNGPRWKNALLSALHVFARHRLLDVWQDGYIRMSSFWDDDIKEAMRSARLAVVLLTDEALQSDYILREELPCLADRQKTENLPVFPVICEPCEWKAHDWLRATQAPNGSNPLSILPQDRIDGVFHQLANEIAKTLSHNALSGIVDSELPVEATRIYLDKFLPMKGSGLREEKLIGREQEFTLLDLAYAQPHTAIVSLVAWGGVGKTMLVQHWLQRLQREAWFGARRVYAWSFYSQGTKEDRQASGDTFLAHALEWFGVQCEPTLSPWDKGHLLADAIVRERTLLILDGIEPLQYPPGPMGGQLRAPGVQSLLKQLARKANDSEHRGLCLVTTREPLTDLADFERRPDAAWGSVLHVDLGNLTAEAGAALLHHAGAKRAGAAEIKADDAELLASSRKVNGHALTLNLLGRFLARGHGGDIRRRDLVKFDEADRREQGGTTFRMLAAFENWFARNGDVELRSLAVLRILGLFDRLADAGCLAALRKPPAIAGLTEPLFHSSSGIFGWAKHQQALPDESWNGSTSFLADFGLVMMQANTETDEFSLDCHPLIREYFAKKISATNPAGWRSAHRRLYDNLRESTREGAEPSLKELEPLYQAVAHGCKADRHQHAFDKVFSDRIEKHNEDYTTKRLGACDSALSTLSCFFDRPWTQVSPRLNKKWHSWLLHGAAYSLFALGRVSEAIAPVRTSMEMDVALGRWHDAADSAANLSQYELMLGQIVDAISDAQRAVTFADRHPEPFFLANRIAEVHTRWSNRTCLAEAFHQAGRRSEAMTLFNEALRLQAKYQPGFRTLYGSSIFGQCELLFTETESAAWSEIISNDASPGRSATLGTALKTCHAVELLATEALAINERGSREVIGRAMGRLTLARAALYRVTLERSTLGDRNTDIHSPLTKVVDDLRRAGHQQFIPLGFLSRAWLYYLKGDASGARADLDEAWDIAERGPMRLHMADIHLYRARLFFREKPYPWKSPQDDLAAAEKLIHDCGYHRRDEELADAKRAIFGSQ